MIRLPTLALPNDTAQALGQLQIAVDGIGDYSGRVTAGKTAFGQHNKKTNAVFKIVREKLYELAGKTRRCAYCEDSMGDEVEHVAPKDLYPEKVFTWENYVYACGPCNGSNKRSKWKIFDGNGTIVDVTRRPKAPVVAPVTGNPLFINPRSEEPMDFLQLDIAGGTFAFVPKFGIGPTERERALYTRTLVGLNTRAGIVERRRQAYVFFRSALESYDHEKTINGSAAKLAEIEQTVRNTDHRSVWKEMQRQRAVIAELTPLFSRNPESLNW